MTSRRESVCRHRDLRHYRPVDCIRSFYSCCIYNTSESPPEGMGKREREGKTKGFTDEQRSVRVGRAGDGGGNFSGFIAAVLTVSFVFGGKLRVKRILIVRSRGGRQLPFIDKKTWRGPRRGEELSLNSPSIGLVTVTSGDIKPDFVTISVCRVLCYFGHNVEKVWICCNLLETQRVLVSGQMVDDFGNFVLHFRSQKTGSSRGWLSRMLPIALFDLGGEDVPQTLRSHKGLLSSRLYTVRPNELT
ncbi:hypothetical protein DB88DRAFT_249388 [Papiliotrema laurentii]|uniref:Uncharacterized protein n=1 Tax=Papiliotrema laurentii TaxID=5418 RepID=A0AAD9FRU3_PAPLA|nr:hypothetical protein DB88DRAFT_249388 [Papiliotrema laurentii]